MTVRRLTLTVLPGIPLVRPGDDLCRIVLDGLAAAGEALQSGDVLVLAQKIVSKSEGRYARLSDVTPSERAVALAGEVDKDPRLVELILSEASEVVRHRPGVLIVAHRLGFVLANAGIDHSNVEQEDGDETVLMLPENPDGSAAALTAGLRDRTGAEVAVVINDSLGRAWRNGSVGIAIGTHGLEALVDLRGKADLFGRPLQVTLVGFADELAAAASLLQGQAAEGTPIVLVRGLPRSGVSASATELVRAKDQDLFR